MTQAQVDECIEIEGTGNDWSDNIILDTCDKYLKKKLSLRKVTLILKMLGQDNFQIIKIINKLKKYEKENA